MSYYEAKIVTGRDDHQTTYDEENVLRYVSVDDAVAKLAPSTRGETWDVFDPQGNRVVRIHVDGGVDHTWTGGQP